MPGYITRGCIFFSLILFSIPAVSQQMSGDESIFIEAPWARASIGTSRPVAAYMTIRNSGTKEITLTTMRADVSANVSIHKTEVDSNGVSKMSPQKSVNIPAGESISLEPGGLHAMMMNLRAPLNEGSEFPLTLMFKNGEEITISVPVLGIGARGPDG